MCPLDALSVSPLFDVATHIDSKCHVSGDSISIDQPGQKLLNEAESKELYFGINWKSAASTCCATGLCTEMNFIKYRTTAENLLSADPYNREIFTLEEATDFTSRFFKPRGS